MSVNITDFTEEIIAETSQGPICGRTFNLDEEKNGHLFYNVPYAHIPTGQRRFAPPEAIANWYEEDVLKKAWSKRDSTAHSIEIFLTMHICTPEVKNNGDEEFDRPVIVFVPGNVQTLDNILKYGPQYLLRENVVLVIVSYRVGILGFVQFADPQANAPGDVGLMDLKAAFTWIRKEIANFGGCSKNVTAYGHGLGARHIRQLLTSSLFENCFDKAILSSCMEHQVYFEGLYENGNYVGRWLAQKVLSLIGRNSEIHTDLTQDDLACVEILRDVDIYILQVLNTFLVVKYTVDTITRNQVEKLYGQLYKVKIPIIIGYNSEECLLDPHLGDNINCEALLGTKKIILKRFIEEHGGLYREIGDILLRKFAQTFLNRNYICKNLIHLPSTPSQRRHLSVVISTVGKYLFAMATIAISMTRQMSPKNVFLYRFNVVSSSTCDDGSPHGLELRYLFRSNWIGPNQNADNRTTEKKELTEVLTKLWAQFARTGNPNLTEPHDLIKSVWQPINQGPLRHCFNILKSGLSYGQIPNLRCLITIQNIVGVNLFT